MSSDEQSDKECPLCMEPFEEVNFYPCTCQYQICTFCWHRLRTDDNGLCPACRQPYPEQPVNYQPLSSAEIQKLKNEKKQKQSHKGKLAADSNNGSRKTDRQHLSAFRVLQRNLVYVVGLSQRLADAELLRKTEYFGKFGKIVKVAVGTASNNSNTTYTAYVTYSKIDDALRAIQAVNNLVVDGRLVKASLGTTKYCSIFLKNQHCHKQECMYLHEVAEDDLSFTKDDMHQGKHTEYERKLHDQLTLHIQNQVGTVTTTASSVSSESTSPSNPAMIDNLINGRFRENCKINNSTAPTVVINTNIINATVSEVYHNSSSNKISCIKSRNISESESESASNGKDSDSSVIMDSRCNGRVRSDSDDKDSHKDLNIPPPGFDDKLPLLESQMIQHESPSSSSCPMMEHINGWYNTDQPHMKDSLINEIFHQPEPFDMHQPSFCLPSVMDNNINPMPPPIMEPSNGIVDSLFQRSYTDVDSGDADLKLKLISSDSKSVMTCNELERILLNNSVPPGFKRQDSLNSCSGATTKSSRQTPVPSGINFFLDLYDDLGFDPFSESSKALADMLEEEKTGTS